MAGSKCVISGRAINAGDVTILIESPKKGRALLVEAMSAARDAEVKRLDVAVE